MNALATWLLALMTAISPPARDAARAASTLRASETGEERAQRYEGIAHDIATVVEGHALPGMTEQQTAALLVAVTFYESSYSLDVDNGDCNIVVDAKGKATKPKRCDGGKSVGLMQLHTDSRGNFGEAYAGELAGIPNRQAMLAAGLKHLHTGVVVCAREWKHENPGWKIQPGMALDQPKMTTGVVVQRGLAWYARNACQSPSGLADGEKKLKLLKRMNGDKFPKLGTTPELVVSTN